MELAARHVSKHSVVHQSLIDHLLALKRPTSVEEEATLPPDFMIYFLLHLLYGNLGDDICNKILNSYSKESLSIETLECFIVLIF